MTISTHYKVDTFWICDSCGNKAFIQNYYHHDRWIIKHIMPNLPDGWEFDQYTHAAKCGTCIVQNMVNSWSKSNE